MRLTEAERTAIVETLRKHFGGRARILLFGSRVDDSARGGDIDLLVELEAADTSFGNPKSQTAIRAKLVAMSEIQRRIGVRKIDLVLAVPSSTEEVVRQARSSGVEL